MKIVYSQLAMQYLCGEENVAESVSQPIEFSAKEISLLLPDEGFISGDWKLQSLVLPVVR